MTDELLHVCEKAANEEETRRKTAQIEYILCTKMCV